MPAIDNPRCLRIILNHLASKTTLTTSSLFIVSQALERNAKGRRVTQFTGRKASGYFHLVRPGAGVHTHDMNAVGERHPLRCPWCPRP